MKGILEVFSFETHNSVLRGQSSRCATPWVYWQEERNIIFTPLHLCDPLTDWNQICYRIAHKLGESTFQIWRKSLQPFQRYELPKFRFFYLFFIFFDFCTLAKIAIKCKHILRSPINLAHRKGVQKANPSIKFGANPMNGSEFMTDYSRKIRSICCQVYRVNYFMEWVENCYVDGVTIVGVPFGRLKGIKIKTMEIWHKILPVSQLRDRFLWIKKY